VSTILLPETDPRGAKAVAIATEAGQWLKCRTADGRKAYGIRSSRDSDEVYFVTRTSCSCYDGQRRTCKHQLAVRLHCDLVAEQQAPAPKADLSRILGKPAPYVTNHVDEDDEPEPLCGPLCSAYTPDRQRVCARPAYHTGAHSWVLRTEREN
jgi:hypothetical protein